MGNIRLAQKHKTAFSGVWRRPDAERTRTVTRGWYVSPERHERKRTDTDKGLEPAVTRQVLGLYWKENMGLRKIAGLCGISHTTVWRIVNESEPPEALLRQLKKYGPL